MLRYKITSEVIEEPVSLYLAKNHLRVTTDEDDNYISSLISSAREYAEGYHDVSYGTREVLAVADSLMPVFELPVTPAKNVTSVVWKDTDGASHDVTDKYVFDEYSSRLILDGEINYGDSTPVAVNPVEITFTAGMTPRKRTIQAMLIMIGEWYENREASVIGVGVYQLPLSAKQLLEMDRHSDL